MCCHTLDMNRENSELFPTCFGRSKQTMGSCKRCFHDLECKKTFSKFETFTTVRELANVPVDDNASLWRPERAIRVIKEKSIEIHKRDTSRFIDLNLDKWRETTSKFLAYCEKNEIDPEHWIEAQLYMTVKMTELKFFKLTPGFFFGPKAVERFSWSQNRNRRLTKDSSEGDTEIDTWFTAELYLARYVIETRLRDEYVDKKEIEATISELYKIPWRINATLRTKHKIKSLQIILDQYFPNWSKSISIHKKWEWEDVANLIRELLPKTSTDGLPQIAIDWKLPLGDLL